MPHADFHDVAVYVPDMAEGSDEIKVAALLEQAEAEILVEFPDLAARLADGRTSLILLRRVEAEMVASVMRNPKGWQSESQTIGGLSNSHTVNVEAASGLLKLTDAHRILIRGTATSSAAGAAVGGLYSLPLSPW